MILKALRRIGTLCLTFAYVMGGLYYLLASPPLHLLYDTMTLPPKATINDNYRPSVYVPGAGFSGFWYHLGLFESIPTKELLNYDYYCYSSGCLGVVLAMLLNTRNQQTPTFMRMNETMLLSNHSLSSASSSSVVDGILQTANNIQSAWLDGSLSRYDIIDTFLDELLPNDDTVFDTQLLSRLHILVTTLPDNMQQQPVHISTPSNRQELVRYLKQTTFIPIFTGRGLYLEDEESQQQQPHQQTSKQHSLKYLDGGFSRALHPTCDFTVRTPMTWDTLVHSLNPGLSNDAVWHLWNMGRNHHNTMNDDSVLHPDSNQEQIPTYRTYFDSSSSSSSESSSSMWSILSSSLTSSSGSSGTMMTAAK